MFVRFVFSVSFSVVFCHLYLYYFQVCLGIFCFFYFLNSVCPNVTHCRKHKGNMDQTYGTCIRTQWTRQPFSMCFLLSSTRMFNCESSLTVTVSFFFFSSTLVFFWFYFFLKNDIDAMICKMINVHVNWFNISIIIIYTLEYTY